ncbi:hypothetical protein OPV22_006162 [Ensete ventricosum]|uniref:Phytocyanin domain-containing protein n=1 Tax=Ensete ventricosum TaxID=4639 RepID=A0AAV8RR30_ENSVE|nr:hypothetical protein OPV22_006162 [Ensete ventricosum]
MAGVVALLVLLVAAAPAARATDYTVGDWQGWVSGVDYNAWASSKTFDVGDTLFFRYNGLHTPAEAGEADYKACSASNSIQTSTDQSTKITLTKPGSRYFICGTPGHCSSGMKLAVTVAGASNSTPSGSPPSTPFGVIY